MRRFLAGTKAPDELDREIFALIHEGVSLNQIAEDNFISTSSVWNRVIRMKASRWATADGRLLTLAQRDRLLQFEKSNF